MHEKFQSKGLSRFVSVSCFVGVVLSSSGLASYALAARNTDEGRLFARTGLPFRIETHGMRSFLTDEVVDYDWTENMNKAPLECFAPEDPSQMGVGVTHIGVVASLLTELKGYRYTLNDLHPIDAEGIRVWCGEVSFLAMPVWLEGLEPKGSGRYQVFRNASDYTINTQFEHFASIYASKDRDFSHLNNALPEGRLNRFIASFSSQNHEFDMGARDGVLGVKSKNYTSDFVAYLRSFQWNGEIYELKEGPSRTSLWMGIRRFSPYNPLAQFSQLIQNSLALLHTQVDPLAPQIPVELPEGCGDLESFWYFQKKATLEMTASGKEFCHRMRVAPDFSTEANVLKFSVRLMSNSKNW